MGLPSGVILPVIIAEVHAEISFGQSSTVSEKTIVAILEINFIVFYNLRLVPDSNDNNTYRATYPNFFFRFVIQNAPEGL